MDIYMSEVPVIYGTDWKIITMAVFSQRKIDVRLSWFIMKHVYQKRTLSFEKGN